MNSPPARTRALSHARSLARALARPDPRSDLHHAGPSARATARPSTTAHAACRAIQHAARQRHHGSERSALAALVSPVRTRDTYTRSIVPSHLSTSCVGKPVCAVTTGGHCKHAVTFRRQAEPHTQVLMGKQRHYLVIQWHDPARGGTLACRSWVAPDPLSIEPRQQLVAKRRT
jgi:hypothetical protein